MFVSLPQIPAKLIEDFLDFSSDLLGKSRSVDLSRPWPIK